MFLVLIPLGFFTGGLSLIATLGFSAVAGGSVGAIFLQILNPKKKIEFINNNSIIFQAIQKKLTEKNKKKEKENKS